MIPSHTQYFGALVPQAMPYSLPLSALYKIHSLTISGLMSGLGMLVYLATSSASACSRRPMISMKALPSSLSSSLGRSTDIATSLNPAKLFKSSSISSSSSSLI
uniref:Uncharacterized protein n=1 Tax=Arundo donax TaxID=35708 RepID=A0A0A9HTW8_ARUDO